MNSITEHLGEANYQSYFEQLYRLALRGMNFGGGDSVHDSGEVHAIHYIKQALQHIGKGMTIFDVGANVGDYSLFLSQQFANATIYSFEPSQAAFNVFLQNMKGTANVQPYHCGFGDTNDTLTLYANYTGSALSSLYPRRLDHFGIDMSNRETVTIQKLDDFCVENQIDHIHFLKLDVEGNELKVLNGAKAMIDSHAIDFIQFEFGGCNIDSRTFFQDFYYFLNEKYTIYRIVKDGLTPIQHYNESLEIFITTNYLAERRR